MIPLNTPVTAVARLVHAINRVEAIHQRAAEDAEIATGAGAIALGDIAELAAEAAVLLNSLRGHVRVDP